MSTETPAAATRREPVLSPVDRISELLFGLFMALTFVGAVSVTEAGQDDIRAMLAAALGCNLAWGLVDAVMYLVRTVADRGRLDHADPLGALGPGRRYWTHDDRGFAVEDGCDGPPVSDTEIEAMRGRVLALPSVPERPTLKSDDLLAAVAVFLLVVASTFPVVLPFVFIQDVAYREVAVARNRARDAVLRRPRTRPLRRLRQLEGWLPDGRSWVQRWWPQ